MSSTRSWIWWAQRPEFRFPHDWQTLKFRQRQIGFAWGPTKDRALQRTASVEIVVASGSGAGNGSACFDRLTLRELPPEPAAASPPQATANSSLPGHEPSNVLDGKIGRASCRERVYGRV